MRLIAIFTDVPTIQVLKDGHQVSRISDFIIYSVEAEFISQVVSTYGPCKYASIALDRPY